MLIASARHSRVLVSTLTKSLLLAALAVSPVALGQTTIITAGYYSTTTNNANFLLRVDGIARITASITGLVTATISGDYARVTASGSGATQAVLQVTGLSPTLTLAVRSASVDATGGIVTLSTGIASIKMLGGTIIARYAGSSSDPTYISGSGVMVTGFLNYGIVTLDGSSNTFVLPQNNANLNDARRYRTLRVGGSQNVVTLGAQYYGISPDYLAVHATITGTSNTLSAYAGQSISVSGSGNIVTFLPESAYSPDNIGVVAGGAIGYVQNPGTYSVQAGGTLTAVLAESVDATTSSFWSNDLGRRIYFPTGGYTTHTAFATLAVQAGGQAVVGGVFTITAPTSMVQPVEADIASGGSASILSGAVATISSGGYAAIESGASNVVVSSGGTASLAPSAFATGQEGAVIIAPRGYRAASKTTDGSNYVYSVEPAGSGMRQRQRRVAVCTEPQQLCPLGGGRMECIDTSRNLESCGGCWSTGEGQDCTAIANAEAVSCEQGRCVVQNCSAGFAIGEGAATCVSAA